MKIQQSTLDKIKTYILETQANSTYNSSPHEPLELCFYKDDWNLGNCYKYLNRYLSTNGSKRGNERDLLKACHYAWLEKVGNDYAGNFEQFKEIINSNNYLDKFLKTDTIEDNLIQVFKDDTEQITDLFWSSIQYVRLGTLLIQQHESNYIDLETT